MFTGTWKESHENLIKLEIPDENIDEEGTYLLFFACKKKINFDSSAVETLTVKIAFSSSSAHGVWFILLRRS